MDKLVARNPLTLSHLPFAASCLCSYKYHGCGTFEATYVKKPLKGSSKSGLSRQMVSDPRDG